MKLVGSDLESGKDTMIHEYVEYNKRNSYVSKQKRIAKQSSLYPKQEMLSCSVFDQAHNIFWNGIAFAKHIFVCFLSDFLDDKILCVQFFA